MTTQPQHRTNADKVSQVVIVAVLNDQPSSLEVAGHDLTAALGDLARRGACVSRMAMVAGHNALWVLSLYWPSVACNVNNTMPRPQSSQPQTRSVLCQADMTFANAGDAMAGQPEGKALPPNPKDKPKESFIWADQSGASDLPPCLQRSQNFGKTPN